MKYLEEFRDPVAGQRVAADIQRLAARLSHTREQPLKLMEICGGHTHTIFKFGLEALLPDNIELVHGPGCPVCVLPIGRVDDAIAIAEQKDVIFTTFGDALRVPGSERSLLAAKAEGADIRTVYSPVDALALARGNPDREVVFFGLGFETTAPATALTLLQAEAERLDNFSVFCNHITIIPTLEAILDAPDLQLGGFIGPGHVTMVIGEHPYGFIAAEHGKPLVVSGFEPLDILQSVQMLLKQHLEQRSEVENQYRRVARPEGSSVAREAMARVFEARAEMEWRGLGVIPQSGLGLRPAYRSFDAEQRFSVPAQAVADPKACQCGEVLKGALKPWDCGVFGTACTPETPIGACMVSSEGACAAYYQYGRLTTLRHRPGERPSKAPRDRS